MKGSQSLGSPRGATGIESVGEWLREFEAAVRARDFERGRALFASDAVAFGTRAEMARGIDTIVAEQWRHVWPRIEAFRLLEPLVHVSGDTAWVATMWQTTRQGRDSGASPRPGRGTFVLERRDGRWAAAHSHFSLVPEDPKL